MRTKDELLTELGKAILDAPDRTQELALLNIGEALIDIRDIHHGVLIELTRMTDRLDVIKDNIWDSRGK